MTEVNRQIISELLSLADLCRDNPRTVEIVKARVEDIIRGSKAWSLPDDGINAAYAALPVIQEKT